MLFCMALGEGVGVVTLGLEQVVGMQGDGAGEPRERENGPAKHKKCGPPFEDAQRIAPLAPAPLLVSSPAS